jgi:hypothetical protein
MSDDFLRQTTVFFGFMMPYTIESTSSLQRLGLARHWTNTTHPLFSRPCATLLLPKTLEIDLGAD